MKKKILIILAVCLAIGGVLFLRDKYVTRDGENCGTLPGAVCEKEIEVTEIDGVEISVREGSVTSTGLVVEAINSTNARYSLTPDIWLQISREGKWVDVTPIAESFPVDEWICSLDPGWPAERAYSWRDEYGNISPGKYRMVIRTMCDGDESELYLAVSFTLEE